MTFPRPGRGATLALALAVGLAPAAQAGDFFHRCHADCADTCVNLPAQRVLVETAAPRVSIQETYQPSRALVTPVLGTAFVPLALPVATFGIVASGPRDIDSSQDDNPLRSVHAAEVHGVRAARARAAARAELEAAQNVLDRSAIPADSTRQGTASPRDATELEKRVKELSDRVDKLADRVSAVEKLTLIHDNYLREKFPKMPAAPPMPGADHP